MLSLVPDLFQIPLRNVGQLKLYLCEKGYFVWQMEPILIREFLLIAVQHFEHDFLPLSVVNIQKCFGEEGQLEQGKVDFATFGYFEAQGVHKID